METNKNVSEDVTSQSKTEELNKAETRAKRKEAKKQNKGKKDGKTNENKPKNQDQDKSQKKQHIEEKNIKNEEKDIKQNNVENNERKNKNDEKPKEVSVKNVENTNQTDDAKSNNTELSKSEIKAQRRAKQEAQRLAKAQKITEKKSEHISHKETENKTEQIQNKTQNTEQTLNKSELRAQRRAIQEAQRKLKTENKEEKVVKPKEIKLKKVVNVADSVTTVSGINSLKKLQLFHHLSDQKQQTKKQLPSNVHSSIIRLASQISSHTIIGSNARCLALLSSIKALVSDYHTPPNEEFCRSLENNLQICVNYLQRYRPLAVSMSNALRHVKLYLTQVNKLESLSDEEKKVKILEGIDSYIRDEIGMADKAISISVQGKIVNGDIIVIYGCSSIVTKILLDAHQNGNGKSFKVIIVDSRPLLEGREMLRKLINAGLNCSYVLINAVSYIMSQATKVLLGAHSLLANGYVMSRTGTAQIALIAKAFNKPVLVCCETYKFSERVQTDSIVHNEIGDPDKVIAMDCGDESPLKEWKSSKYITPLNLLYDVTPPDLVTAVVTELAILPCTSVPVVLRIKPTEIAV